MTASAVSRLSAPRAPALAVMLGAWPELAVALYLSSGTLKANPLFSFIPVDFTVLTGAVVVAAMAIRVVRGGVPPVSRAAALYLVLSALMLLSVLWSPAPSIGLHKALLFQTVTFVAFACPFVLFRTRAQLERLMIILVAVGLFVAATAVSTIHQAAPLVAAGGNEIELAVSAAVGMFAALGYLLLIGRSRWRLLWLGPAAFLGLIVIQSGSRGVLVGMVLGTAFLALQALLYGLPGGRRLLGALAAGMVAAAAAGGSLAGGATHKYTSYLFHADVQSVLIGREWILSQGWALSRAHPLGLGAGGFDWATGWDHSHNMFFELSSEQGLVAVALVVALIVAAWRTRLRGPGGRSPESAICGALILLFLVQAMVADGPNDQRAFWFVLGLALALPQFSVP